VADEHLERVHSQTVLKENSRGLRLPLEKVTDILRRHDSGQGPTAIASSVGSDIRTVGAVIRRYRDRAASAKALLAQSSIDAAASWLQAVPIASARGDHRPAKELLQAVGSVAMGQAGDGAGGAKVQVNVVIGTPGNPIPHDPIKP
jgi:hypothetical protein